MSLTVPRSRAAQVNGVCGLQVTYAKGWGSFKSPTEVEVAGLDGNNQTISTKNVIIAAGSEVINLPGVTIDEER